MSQDIVAGIRSMRTELVKMAARNPIAIGAATGAASGIIDAVRRGTGVVDDLAKIRAGTSNMDDAAKASFMEKNKNVNDLFDPSTNKLRPLSWENKGQYLKAFGPDAAKTLASWAGSGATAGLAVKGVRDYKKAKMLDTYGPAAAAGVAGLVGYKAMRD